MSPRPLQRELVFVVVVILGVATIGLFAPTISAQDTDHTSIQPRIGLSENSSRVVYLDSVEGAGYGAPDFTLTDSLAADSASTENRLARYSFETKLERTANESERNAIARNATAYFRMEANRLHALESQKRARFNAGEISEDAYLRELGMIHRRAGALSSAISSLQDHPGVSREADETLQTIDGELIGLQGPLRSEIAAVVTGDGEASDVYVSASSAGVTLSRLEGGSFVHVAYVPENRDTVAGEIPLMMAYNITRAYYPTLLGAGTESFSTQGSDIVDFTIGGATTRTTGYMDATTQQIFFEIHRSSVDRLETDTLVTATGNNTTLVVSETYVGGPLQIRVENRTGAPLPADVFINETRVGQTGEDGDFWMIAEEPPYPVRVSTPEAELSVNITSYTR